LYTFLIAHGVGVSRRSSEEGPLTEAVYGVISQSKKRFLIQKIASFLTVKTKEA